jgi:cystathionine gamma-synthase
VQNGRPLSFRGLPDPNKPGKGTLCVHGGEPRQKAYAAVTVPVALTATYSFSGSAEIRDHFDGRIEREEYGRYGNPTVRMAETKLAALDAAEDAALFGSGMAAISTTLLALLKQGQHVVLTADCYRRTRQLVTTILPNYGITADLADPADEEALERVVVPGKTRVLLSESPTNPYLRVCDMERLIHLRAKHRGMKLVIDSTFATPVNQRPLEQGADLVIHSGTKYLGGHNDLLAGSVSGSSGLVSAIRDLRSVLGPILDPHSAYLLLRGMKTLDLRVRRQNESALELARWLSKDARVERVYYPGLDSHPDYALAARQMTGFGGVVSFLVRGDLDATSRCLDRCEVFTLAPSLGGVESLIEQPALMSFYEMTTEQRQAVGIPDNLVRMSVGLEDVADLRGDLDRALGGSA